MTFKVLIEALLIDWVRRSMHKGERLSATGTRMRGQVWREPTDGRWQWAVQLFHEPPEGREPSIWGIYGWTRSAQGSTLTRLGSHARLRVALRAYAHGTELVR